MYQVDGYAQNDSANYVEMFKIEYRIKNIPIMSHLKLWVEYYIDSNDTHFIPKHFVMSLAGDF